MVSRVTRVLSKATQFYGVNFFLDCGVQRLDNTYRHHVQLARGSFSWSLKSIAVDPATLKTEKEMMHAEKRKCFDDLFDKLVPHSNQKVGFIVCITCAFLILCCLQLIL
jgi:hypothetical protein